MSTGDRLGPYELLVQVGEGAMGAVWKARDTRLDRIVAIKIAKDEFSERFENEARAIAALNHPHICQIFDVGPNYLVMEFVEGAPLRGPLPTDKAMAYADQILDALEAAHAKGITHRDLKPSNIFLTSQGIKLLDFGLAKRQKGPITRGGSTVTIGHTHKGEIVGTLQYMSPEQLEGKEVDARSDLFSLGCVLYEVLTGRRPFEGESAAAVIAAIMKHEPAPSDIAPAIDRVLRRAMAKEPAQRFQTARDLKAALSWALLQKRDGRTAPSPRFWIATVAVAAAAIGTGWIIAKWQSNPPIQQSYRFEINPPEGGRFDMGPGSGGIAISPDGTNVAYIASLRGKTGLWVRPLDGVSARLIEDTEGAYAPFWSPDGRSIAFFARGKLQRVAVAGGDSATICDVNAARGGTWTSDGRILFSFLTSTVFVVPETGGTPSPLTKPDRDIAHYWPQALPGGNFLYVSQRTQENGGGIYGAPLAKPTERVHLLDTDSSALYVPGLNGKGYLLWLRGTALMAQEFDPVKLSLSGDPRPISDPVGRSAITGRVNMAASGELLLYDPADSTSQLAWLDRKGQTLAKAGSPNEYVTFRTSPDGRHIAAAIGNPPRADLWILDEGRDLFSRFTYSSRSHADPVWSPDGRTLLFRSGAPAVLSRKDSSGAGEDSSVLEDQRGPQSFQPSPTDWSRDGRFVLYHANSQGTGRDLWVAEVSQEGKQASKTEPRAYVRTQFSEGEGQFAPQSPARWVAYQSNESGRPEVYIQAFPEPRGKFQISTTGGRFPKWGPGARELFYLSPDDVLMAVSLKFVDESVEASTPQPLFPLPTPTINFIPYDVSSDGQRFLVQIPPEKASALTMVVHWQAAGTSSPAAQ